MSDANLLSERYYRFHLWRMALGLAFYLAIAVGMTLSLLNPERRTALVVVPAAVFVLASVTLGIAVRGRRWPRLAPEDRRILTDEWVRMNIERARKISLRTVWLAQGPLMFLVAYLPSDPTVGTSVIGMASLTIAAAGTAFFGSYLVFSRETGDG